MTTGGGHDTLSLDTVLIAPALLSPVTRHVIHVPFVDGPTLVGLDYDDTLPEGRRVYMHWRASDRPALARHMNLTGG